MAEANKAFSHFPLLSLSVSPSHWLGPDSPCLADGLLAVNERPSWHRAQPGATAGIGISRTSTQSKTTTSERICSRDHTSWARCTTALPPPRLDGQEQEREHPTTSSSGDLPALQGGAGPMSRPELYRINFIIPFTPGPCRASAISGAFHARARRRRDSYYCAVGGLAPAETVWRRASKHKVPRLAFVNKITPASFFKVTATR